MIEYDYEIQRDEGNVIKKYTPNKKIGKKLPNLVLIEAPNSSGKSTLLNILAVGFFGLKNSEGIVDSLVDDMKNLVLSEHQKIWFKLKIEEGNGISLISEKKIDGNPIVYKAKKSNKKEKMVPTAPETFNREYRLIYDIPDKPRERLKDILKDIESLQLIIGEDIADFKNYLEKILEEISKSKNPEQIKKLEERIRGYDNLIEKTQERIKGYEGLLKDLELYSAVKFYHQYYQEYNDLSKKLKKIRNKNRYTKRHYSKYLNYMREFTSLVSYIMGLRNDITDNIEKISQPDLIELMEKLNKNLKEEILLKINSKDYDTKLLSIDQTLTDLYELIDDLRERKKNLLNKQIKEIEITKKLIEILEEYKDLDIKLPGTDKIVGRYLEELKKDYNDKKVITEEYDAIEETIKKIEEMKNILGGEFRFSVRKLRKMLPEDERDVISSKYAEEADEREEKKLRDKLKWLDDKVEEYFIKCKNYGIDKYSEALIKKQDLERKDYMKEFIELNENELFKKLEYIKQEIEKHKGEERTYEVLRDEEKEKLKN